MKRNWVARAIMIALVAVPLFFAGFGYVVMRLWNWLMPALFGWHEITFWQAIGILVLSKILFGGFHGRHGGQGNWRHRMSERWEKMTPEEREKFRQSMRGRFCGPFEPPAEAPKA